MKTKKLFLSVFLSMSFMFSCFVSSIPVYASNSGTGSSWDSFNGKISDFMQDLTGTVLSPFSGISNAWKQYFNDNKSNYTDDATMTPEEFVNQNYYYNNETGNNEVSVNLSNCLIDFTRDYVNDNYDYIYGYSFPVTSFLPNFTDQDFYLAFTQFVSEHQFVFVPRYNSYNTNTNFFVIDDIQSPGLTGSINYSAINCSLYSSWNPVTSANGTYRYNSTTKEFYLYSNGGTVTTFYLSLSEQLSKPTSNGVLLKADTNKETYLVYKNLDALKSATQGVQDYYITDSYNNFTHVDNSQNISQTTLDNSISYSDISNYVNSYYVNNQSYPTSNDVYNYINNYTPSGGGSGDDNGNGSGDDNNNIWDFLGSIGDFLGNLISSLGSVLSGILSLLTDVIDTFIGENGLPNIIGRLIEYFLPFLPTWIPQLIGLSVVLALIIGVIKLIRGH